MNHFYEAIFMILVIMKICKLPKNKKENEKNFISCDAWYRRIGLCTA